jgi:hypothetical protein
MDVLPRGYAVAWVQPWRMTAVVLPFGLHAIASMLRSWWLAGRVWYRPDIEAQAYERGRAAGHSAAEAEFQYVKADITQKAAELRAAAFREGYQFCTAALLADVSHQPMPEPPAWVTRHG